MLEQELQTKQQKRDARVKTSMPKKLIDATDVGQKRARKLTLLLVEGDSAKPIAQRIQRKKGDHLYGVYPVSGKLPNPRNRKDKKASTSAAQEETEEANSEEDDTSQEHGNKNKKNQQAVKLRQLKSAMGLAGLERCTVDEQAENLRYGNIGIMTDPDDDGTDIKCQLVNIFSWEFPKLCRNKNPHHHSNAKATLKFYEYVLPVSEGNYRFGRQPFLKEDDQVHFNQQNQSELLHISYLKGLGSFNTEDAVKRLHRHNSPPPIKQLTCDVGAEEMAEIAFGEAFEASRKSYVHSYQRNSRDMSKTQTDFSELLRTDFVQYMGRDVTRKIPSVMDGLVDSKRKVVYVVQRVMPNGEKMKTAQLGSETANLTNYHHDENTLSKGIVPLAADYTGAANLPLLVGEGQFGTREYDGKNFSSPRYTHVRPHKNLHLLFKQRFELCLKRTEAEGQNVEFVFFVAPVIGYNAMQGTASGSRCMVRPRNVLSLVQLYRKRLHGELNFFHCTHKDLMKPCYNGWNGSIEQNHNGAWSSNGCCHYEGKDRNDYAEYRVTTLPVTSGTQNTGNYEEQLGNWQKNGWIAHWQPRHTDEDICFAVYLSREQQ